MNHIALAQVAFNFLQERELLDLYLLHNHKGIKNIHDLAKWMSENQANEFIDRTITWDNTPAPKGFHKAYNSFSINMEDLYRTSACRAEALSKLREDV